MADPDRRFAAFAALVVAGLLAVAGINLVQARRALRPTAVLSYSQLLDRLEHGQLLRVALTGHQLRGLLTDGTRFESYTADDPDLVRSLRVHGVVITVVPPAADGPSWAMVLVAGTIALTTGMFLARGRQTLAGGLGVAKARVASVGLAPVSFGDVGGVDEARDSLREIADLLRGRQAAGQLGGRPPRGVLLVGPPGNGKTLLARAMAGEAQIPFLAISGADFVEMYVGIGAARIRSLFRQARRQTPCIVFIDEIDAVGRRRGTGVGQGNDEREQTLNQLLVEMDGFDQVAGVLVIAATNRADILDPALLRPGRFDRQVLVAPPDEAGRAQVLAVHARRVSLATDVDLAALAHGTAGFSSAELMNLVNEAALLAARRGLGAVGMAELDAARDTVALGAEHPNRVVPEPLRLAAAYREAARVLASRLAPGAACARQASIVDRMGVAGRPRRLPGDDGATVTLRQLTGALAVLMAGRAAEELVFGRAGLSSAGAGELAQATRLARTMVTRLGMSERLGPITHGPDGDEDEPGAGGTQTPWQQDAIGDEIRRFVDAALDTARAMLAANRPCLDQLAQELLQHRTLVGERLAAMLAGVVSPADADAIDAPPPGA